MTVSGWTSRASGIRIGFAAPPVARRAHRPRRALIRARTARARSLPAATAFFDLSLTCSCAGGLARRRQTITPAPIARRSPASFFTRPPRFFVSIIGLRRLGRGIARIEIDPRLAIRAGGAPRIETASATQTRVQHRLWVSAPLGRRHRSRGPSGRQDGGGPRRGPVLARAEAVENALRALTEVDGQIGRALTSPAPTSGIGDSAGGSSSACARPSELMNGGVRRQRIGPKLRTIRNQCRDEVARCLDLVVRPKRTPAPSLEVRTGPPACIEAVLCLTMTT